MTTARLTTVDLPDFGMPAVRPEVPAGRYAESPGRAPRARGGRGARPARRVRGPRAQREPGVPERLRPALRGGDADRGAGRRSADPGGQRVLRDGRRRATADAPRAVPGLQPAQPAARPVPAAARHPGGGGDRPGHAGRRAGLEVVRGSGADRDPGVHRRRAAGPRGRLGLGRQRERAPHRPRRRAAGDQRRRPDRRVRARVVPDVRRHRPAARRPRARDDRGRGGPAAPLERHAAVVPPDAHRRAAGPRSGCSAPPTGRSGAASRSRRRSGSGAR